MSDTVGLGFDRLTLRVFFTQNGVFKGPLSVSLSLFHFLPVCVIRVACVTLNVCCQFCDRLGRTPARCVHELPSCRRPELEGHIRGHQVSLFTPLTHTFLA
jgi:hypothetical protein